MRSTSALIGMIAVFVIGCSDDPSGPQVAQIAGTWTYNASNIVGGGISCNISGVTLILTQSASTFSGTTTGGHFSCSAPGVPTQSTNLGNDVIANGTINGNAVVFDIATSDIHHTGSISGNSISGVVVFRLESGNSTTTLTGQFSAVKM